MPEKEKKNIYITTTLPYVNSEPHVGFAMEIIRADAIARYKKLMGHEVFFNTGTDEHGLKLFQAAEKAGKGTKEYVDEYAEKFRGLKGSLGLSPDIHFIRTTDPHHESAAKEFWTRVEKNGFIYKKNYKAKYCVGCESEKTDSELVDGKCAIHPHMELEVIEEENYFFKLSAFGDRLLALYEKNPKLVIPDFRLNEMREFVKRGLEDFSISRLKTKMPWGIGVPGDEAQVMYVWFDALVNYISTLGWPETGSDFEKFWVNGETIQYCGKDNTRFQAVMWQAMLMAAELPNTGTIVVNGFITGEGGIKMSKSLGNAVNPIDIVEEYGTDALRLFVLRDISPFEDSSFTMERFKASYNANLANGIGNLVSRVLTLAAKYDAWIEIPDSGETSTLSKEKIISELASGGDSSWRPLENFDFKSALDQIWNDIKSSDKYMNDEAPFKKIKTDPEGAKEDIRALVNDIWLTSIHLEPFLPNTAQILQSLIEKKELPKAPLFPRKE